MREGIRAFLDDCYTSGRSSASAHYLFVNGMDALGNKLPNMLHLQRGGSLSRLTKMWLSTWGEEED